MDPNMIFIINENRCTGFCVLGRFLLFDDAWSLIREKEVEGMYKENNKQKNKR